MEMEQAVSYASKGMRITKEEASALGYEVVAASPFEVGLIKNGKGIRTWFCQYFDRKLPELDHPLIMESIMIMEDYERTMIHSSNANKVDPGNGQDS